MQIEIKLEGVPETLKSLAQLEDLANGKSAVLRPAFQAMGEEALRMISENFMEQGTRVGGWPRLSPVTLLLRRRGEGAKIKDEADLSNKPHQILQDTGMLFNSLHPGRPGNLFQLGDLQVTVGTADRKAAFHQQGGASTFKFDPKRFDENVAKVLPGAKPKLTPKGKKSRAKKNWNPFYFKWQAILKKMDGKSYNVPARPILWQLNSSEQQRIFVILEDHVIKQAGKLWES